MALVLYDDLLGFGAFASGGHEEVDAVGLVLHGVGVGAGRLSVVGLEVVDERALHVVHLDVDLSGQVLEVEGHLPVVGVGYDGEVGQVGLLLVDAVEGAHEPVSALDAVAR